MSKGIYNFEEDNKDFDKTVRLDKIHKEVHKEVRRSERNAKKASKKNKRGYEQFTLLIIVIAIIAFVVIFAFAYNAMRGDPPDTTQPTKETLSTDSSGEVIPETGDGIGMVAVVKDPDLNGKIRIFDTEKGIYRNLKLAENTTDESGALIGEPALAVGDIVMMDVDLYSSTIEKLYKAENILEISGMSGFRIDSQAQTITLGSDIFNYSSDTICMNKDKELTINQLDPNDILFLRGIGNEIWYIEVERSHGYISLKNPEGLKDGTIRTDGGEPVAITGAMQLNLSPGNHNIVITGSNIETYVADIFIEAGAGRDIDLATLPTKTGLLRIISNVDDFAVTVDGELYTGEMNPMVLPRGEHMLTLTKGGYKEREIYVVVTEEYKEVEVNLEPVIKTGTLSITMSPSDADIYIDNEYVGAAPLEITLTYGEHKVRAEKMGYTPTSILVNIYKEQQELNGVLQEEVY
ncbi:MAG: PEGA domain-containing protein [Firmicutes bacterium]|nr:PEGA domain-containing protein [Bacillota bacterium]